MIGFVLLFLCYFDYYNVLYLFVVIGDLKFMFDGFVKMVLVLNYLVVIDFDLIWFVGCGGKLLLWYGLED